MPITQGAKSESLGGTHPLQNKESISVADQRPTVKGSVFGHFRLIVAMFIGTWAFIGTRSALHWNLVHWNQKCTRTPDIRCAQVSCNKPSFMQQVFSCRSNKGWLFTAPAAAAGLGELQKFNYCDKMDFLESP